MSAPESPQGANHAPAGGSEAREPDGPPRGRTPESEARSGSNRPRAWGDPASAPSGRKLKVTLVKGTNSCRADHRATVRGLGLKRIRHTVELEDTQAVRGMIDKVSYLVQVTGD